MCLTYIEADHRLCAKSLILNYSLLEVFILANKKDILLFLGLFVLIFYSGGEGVFSLFKQSVGFLFYLFIDFFSPFRFERSFNKINYENEWGSRGALCIIYLNLFSLLSCNWHYLNGAEIDKIRSAVSLSRSPNAATVELIIFMFHA